MQDFKLRKFGLFAIYDSGAPPGKENYVTVVSIHGYLWHSGEHFKARGNVSYSPFNSGGFLPILPFAKKHGVRLVLLNRRDYLGTEPLSEDEMKPYRKAMSSNHPEERRRALLTGAEHHARDFYEFLQSLIQAENVPVKGGIIVTGWSLGGTLVTSFLSYVKSFPPGRIDILPYIRYFVLYSAPFFLHLAILVLTTSHSRCTIEVTRL